MARPGQRTEFDSRLKQATAGRLQKLLAAVAAGLLLLTSGCQSTTDCGMWRIWADVNSVGEPAAFVDQMRSDGFRTAAPPNVLHEVTAINVPPSVSKFRSQEFEVIPMGDPAFDAEQTSHATSQAADSVSPQLGVAIQPVVKPHGVWLF